MAPSAADHSAQLLNCINFSGNTVCGCCAGQGRFLEYFHPYKVSLDRVAPDFLKCGKSEYIEIGDFS